MLDFSSMVIVVEVWFAIISPGLSALVLLVLTTLNVELVSVMSPLTKIPLRSAPLTFREELSKAEPANMLGPTSTSLKLMVALSASTMIS